jgi:hypothetical protein
MSKLVQFVVKSFTSMIFVLFHAVTHIINGVWWHSPCPQKSARCSFVKKCFKRIGALHLDYQRLWLSLWFIEGGGYQRC